jgi:TonB family protein
MQRAPDAIQQTPSTFHRRVQRNHQLRIVILALLLAVVSHARAIEADVTVPFELRWYMLSMPRPTYPIEARERHITGRGICDIVSRPETGTVTHVTVLQSTGSKLLDNAAAKAFTRWRARPGKISHARVPFTFTFGR